MMWAYVLSAVLSVCGVSSGLSGRTVVAMTRNLKVQMSLPALCGRWYIVAHRRKINKWPPLYFWFVLGILVQKGYTCCLSALCGRSELLGHWTAACPLQNWLLFFFFFGRIRVLLQFPWFEPASAITQCVTCVIFWGSNAFLLYFLMPTSAWKTFIYIVQNLKMSCYNFSNLPTYLLFLSALKAVCIFRNHTVGWKRLKLKVPWPFRSI